jgi:hypothetical protein
VKLTARVKLSLLRGFQAQLGAGSPLAVPTRKTQALLARGNLRHALSRVRKALPAGARSAPA